MVQPPKFSTVTDKTATRYDGETPWNTKLGYEPKEEIVSKKSLVFDIGRQSPRKPNDVHSKYPIRMAMWSASNSNIINHLCNNKLSMFSKTEKKLHDDNNFNPPPGYYPNAGSFDNKNQGPTLPTFPRQHRFEDTAVNPNPGPGAYYNDRT